MKFLIPFIFFFTFFSSSKPINVSGKWAWNGNGCRDNSLSIESHITKPSSAGSMEVTSSILVFKNDGSISMISVLDGENIKETANYTVNGNKITIEDNGHTGIFFLLDDSLVTKDMDDHQNNLCKGNQVFVRIFEKSE